MTPKRILIVYDDRMELLTLSQILLLNGYQLSYAESNEKALRMIRKSNPDLVICAARSQKQDVAGFFRTVRMGERTRSTPFIFIADPTGKLPAEVANLPPKQMLLRPFTRDQLAITVQKNLKH